MLEAGGLHPEPVEVEAEGVKGGEDVSDLGGGLEAANGANAYEGGVVVDVVAVRSLSVHFQVEEVLVWGGALEDGDDREGGVEVAQEEEVLGGEVLVVEDGELGTAEGRGLAHVVLGSGPEQVGHVLAEAADLLDVGEGGGAMGAVVGDVVEASGVENPLGAAGGIGELEAGGQVAAGDHQGDVIGDERGWVGRGEQEVGLANTEEEDEGSLEQNIV